MPHWVLKTTPSKKIKHKHLTGQESGGFDEAAAFLYSASKRILHLNE